MGIVLLKLFVSVVVAVGLWGFWCDVVEFLWPQEEVGGEKGK